MTEQAPSHHDSAIHHRVNTQFGAAAAAYSVSPTHGDPAALQKVVELAQPRPEHEVLDIATGAGHTAMALAPHVARVVAYDMTEQMLEETRRNAADRELTNLVTRQGVAESLPFPDESFDVVTVRQAPHHYADVRKAVSEMGRVVKRSGRVVIIDSVSSEEESLDQQWNYIEKLRDSSHVRNYRPSEWRRFITEAGLQPIFEECSFTSENGGPMSFDTWVGRMKTPPAAVEELTRLFREASAALTAALRIQIVDGAIYFCVPILTVVVIRGGDGAR
jgi:ubiquinone/menaquinone biosynthesis C-methylase UbiE